MDQKNKQLEVDYAIGRDIRPEEIKKISATLKEWCDSCESVLQTIENQIDRANSAKAMRNKHTEDLDAEVFFDFFILLKTTINFLGLCSMILDCKFEENVENALDWYRWRLHNGL